MPKIIADNVFHPPSGSNVPGKVEANPYDFYPPNDIRHLIETEEDLDEVDKMKSSLRKWERLFDGFGNPFKMRSAADFLRIAALRLAGLDPQPINVPYYMDTEVPEGLEDVLDGLSGIHDNDNNVRFDYTHQGERPHIDVDMARGDFLSPSDPVVSPGHPIVKPRGDGADPAGMEITYPMGGDIGGMPGMI